MQKKIYVEKYMALRVHLENKSLNIYRSKNTFEQIFIEKRTTFISSALFFKS